MRMLRSEDLDSVLVQVAVWCMCLLHMLIILLLDVVKLNRRKVCTKYVHTMLKFG